MTTNPHQPADIAHVLAQQVAALIEQRLHDAIQALDNRAALAGHWEGVANAQRGEIERLKQHAEIVRRINGFIGLYDCVVAGQPVDEAVLTVLDAQRAEIVELRARVRELEGRAVTQASPAPPRLCDNCGKPLDNLRGQFVMRGQGGRTLEVCHECEPGLRQIGYAEVARAKGLETEQNRNEGRV
jgi:hypothetical protein